MSFEVAEGETLALVGANGAGKTTLLRAIAGAHRPAAGRISFDGARHHRACRRTGASQRGIALVPEGRRLFPNLTVEENLRVAAPRRRSGPLDGRRGARGVPAAAAAAATSAPRASRAASSRRPRSAAR